ncbi:MAG: metalloprotease PmbA [Aquaspirillum sp.]
MNRAQPFSYSQTQLEALSQRVLTLAQQEGATAAEVEVSESQGQNVSVRLSEVETLEYTRDKGLGVTVYIGQSKGHANTSDFSEEAMLATVRAACDIARFTAADPCAGLADSALLAQGRGDDLDLFHPWHVPVEQAIDLAKEMEAAGQALDPRIRNSEGANVSTHTSQFIYANSAGFSGGYQTSRHALSASLIAEDDSGMQRDYWYAVARCADDLPPVAQIGRRAAERSLRRLGAKRVKTCQVPVLFEPALAAGLVGSFVAAVSGGSLYRNTTFLADSLGTQVFAPCVQLYEDPFIKRGLASGCFDAEGVATHARDVVKEGVLQGYFLSSYSARKLGMQTTGNAGGAHNLLLASTGQDFAALLKLMGTGLVVTELLGHGVNPVTGDYSRGAAGFWVENGELAYPVEEITIAGNLKQMFRDIVAIGSDIEIRGGKQTGSILLQNMTVAGV